MTEYIPNNYRTPEAHAVIDEYLQELLLDPRMRGSFEELLERVAEQCVLRGYDIKSELVNPDYAINHAEAVLVHIEQQVSSHHQVTVEDNNDK